MNTLVVVAHPLDNSLCAHLAAQTIAHLKRQGHQVEVKNLYLEAFQPALTQTERQSYYQPEFDDSLLAQDIAQLKRAESLVLVFPTWWFGFPAILKGWFDRVWAPGHAYDHASDLGAIQPRLQHLKEMKVVTTLGSPWWVDRLVMFRPVRRILKTALLGACAAKCRFSMLSLYQSEKVDKQRIEAFVKKICQRF
ncbi:NAD(P)H-dependent oxidoreductase [Bowmanella pacifica]|uniref:NAD(P)H dehydrogenase (Quinone) n=1 Tax=Bowmanella pacifica TaxID=502051 RepID=A0A917Z4B0_9ALTE|nr:NAD(P)H-dependent oxidoreductase [Bowmanella pacifica]GGO74708.1 NAD(P)H dehydrogenase (quinone) [Bowmanella pacifica]